jgi:hypothetical protein
LKDTREDMTHLGGTHIMEDVSDDTRKTLMEDITKYIVEDTIGGPGGHPCYRGITA